MTKLTHEIDHLESTVARLKPKELDGDSYTARGMLLNAIVHAKPYHGLRPLDLPMKASKETFVERK